MLKRMHHFIVFYSTTWIAKIAANSPAHHDSASSLRLGSLGMLMHAIVSIFFTIVSPSLLQLLKRLDLGPLRRTDHLTTLWAFSNLALGLVLLSTYLAASAHSIAGAMVVIALTGFPWAFVQFVPNALVNSAFIQQLLGETLVTHKFFCPQQLGILIQKHDAEEPDFEGESRADDISLTSVTHVIGQDEEDVSRDMETDESRPRLHTRSSSIHAHISSPSNGEIDGKRHSRAHSRNRHEEEMDWEEEEANAEEVLSFGPRTARDVEDGESSSSEDGDDVDEDRPNERDEEEGLMEQDRDANGHARGRRRRRRGKQTRTMAQRSGTVLGLHNVSSERPSLQFFFWRYLTLSIHARRWNWKHRSA